MQDRAQPFPPFAITTALGFSVGQVRCVVVKENYCPMIVLLFDSTRIVRGKQPGCWQKTPRTTLPISTGRSTLSRLSLPSFFPAYKTCPDFGLPGCNSTFLLTPQHHHWHPIKLASTPTTSPNIKGFCQYLQSVSITVSYQTQIAFPSANCFAVTDLGVIDVRYLKHFLSPRQRHD
jgi:hypothetical protein